MMMPAVTAIITTFNRSSFVKEAIGSVLSQSFRDFELLVLDNSSTDDTRSVVESFKDKRLNYIRHEPLNISQARNLGVRQAKGKYIAFLDDDDLWLPDKLEKQLEVFEEGDDALALVYGGLLWVDSNGIEVGVHKPVLRGRVLTELLLQKDAFTGSASNAMLRKSAVESLGGYDEDVPTGEDLDLYLRLAEKYLTDFTDESVVKVRTHSGPRLGDKLRDAAELELKMMNRYGYVFEQDRKLRSFYLQKIGGKLVRVGDACAGRKYIISAIKTNPLNLIAYFQLLLSALGRNLYYRIHRGYLTCRGLR